jgi:hypothetical protein
MNRGEVAMTSAAVTEGYCGRMRQDLKLPEFRLAEMLAAEEFQLDPHALCVEARRAVVNNIANQRLLTSGCSCQSSQSQPKVPVREEGELRVEGPDFSDELSACYDARASAWDYVRDP